MTPVIPERRADGQYVKGTPIDVRLWGRSDTHSLGCWEYAGVNPDHLFLGTVADNNRDRAEKGRSKGTFQSSDTHPAKVRSGERHWCVKLSADDVADIRNLYASGGVSHAQIAKHFRVHPATVSRIVRRLWRKEVA